MTTIEGIVSLAVVVTVYVFLEFMIDKKYKAKYANQPVKIIEKNLDIIKIKHSFRADALDIRGFGGEDRILRFQMEKMVAKIPLDLFIVSTMQSPRFDYTEYEIVLKIVSPKIQND